MLSTALLLAATTLPPVRVTAPMTSDVAGWNGTPAARTPLQSSTIWQDELLDRGAFRLADLARIDASVGDSYNSVGYWDLLTVRGFTIDNRFNYRRDGLPINAETSLPLDNKERVEILKGTSGLQAGTSAPGGLVNLVVKRPTDAPLRSARLEWRSPGNALGAVDLSQRFGAGDRFGVRVNAAAERLDPYLRDARGERNLFALAADWRITSNSLLEAEIEHSHRSEPSQPAFSLLGNAVPTLIDPRINLNNQPWSQPVVMDGTTGSFRWTQRLSADWRFTLHGASQRLRSDDRLAFPYGCTATGQFDRYCPDGTYDYYDFRSDGEHRRTDSLQAEISGRFATGGLQHDAAFGLLRSHVRHRLGGQAYNFVGTGNVAGTAVVPEDGSLTLTNTNRDEASSELFARDHIALFAGLDAWLGLRHTRLQRDSVQTDGSEPTSFKQSLTSPSLALSKALTDSHLVYASWGRGAESEVAPNRARYTNAGQALPALLSRQTEIGVKAAQGDRWTWNLAAFDIERPLFRDVGSDCFSDTVPGTCTHLVDGRAHHRGLTLDGLWRTGAWTFTGGAQALRARVQGVAGDPNLNGKRPTNVPARSLKGGVRYRVASVAGLTLQADGLAESNRMVLQDNSVRIGGYGRIDLGLRYDQTTNSGTALTWRAGVDNALDRRAWRESPTQFGHAYLYPLAPRTWRVSVDVGL